ncbi:MAG TPA: hypothetical protein QF469_08795 [Sphingomonas sanguinis]|uniref:hypothetical protein n=1 Tax=Sphingomonas sanguinis TaxID=33051 RepID=UPI002AC0786C|nr:hypothetical protein [Sphingomonas sanguinis]
MTVLDREEAIFARENLRTYMRTHWNEAGETLEPGKRLGIEIAELIAMSKKRGDKLETVHLDLWVEILDELNSWLISLLGVIYRPGSRGDAAMTDFERSVVMLLVKLVSDTTSMRHLVMLGFDSSARTLMRSISEYMQVLVAIIDDPALAKKFVTADTPETSNAFYFQHLARGKLHKRIRTAWRRFFQSADDATDFFAEQQRELGQVLSGTAHPSFAGGHLAATQFIQTDPYENWLGHWGARSNMSILTISIYTSCFMPLVLLGAAFPFEGFDKWLSIPIKYDPEDEFHRHVKAGRSVLASLILSLSKDSNIPFIYPKGLEPDATINDAGAEMSPGA